LLPLAGQKFVALKFTGTAAKVEIFDESTACVRR
jgi:hypothetical protein